MVIRYFVKELEEMYNSIKNGKNIELDAIPVRVVNYIEWNNKKVIENENDKKYWENKLKDVSDVLQLPFDFKRPDIQTYAGDNVIINIEDAYKEKLIVSVLHIQVRRL